MKKIAFLFVSILATTVVLIAQPNINESKTVRNTKVSISGKVSDALTGIALPGASISFPDLHIGSITDVAGTYRIQNIPEGTYPVEVSYVGYSSVLEVVDLHGDVKKDFTLTPSVLEGDMVTVTGVSSATLVKRTPIPLNIIRKMDLLRNTSTNLFDNLSKTPGVAQVSTGPAVSKPFIRGLGYNRVVVINDGIRHEGEQWGDEHGVELDELNVNKVEILKGPASLMYGSDALAGVVNIISVQPVPEGTIGGSILGAYQTNNRQRNVHADIGGNSKGFIWGIDGSWKTAGDYKNKYDGYVLNSKFHETNFGGYLGVNKNWGYSHFIFSNFNQHFGLIDAERDDATGKFLKLVNNGGVEAQEIATDADFKSTNPLIPRQHLLHLRISADNSFNCGKNRLTLNLAYQHDQRQEFGNVVDPDERALWFNLHVVNYDLQYHFAEKKNWKSTIGVNGMHESHENKGVEFLIPDYSLFDIGGFLYTQKRMDKLTFSGGLRFDHRALDSKLLMDGSDIKFPAFKKDFSTLSGSAGLSFEASKSVTWKLNLARGFRAPSIPELASNGAHEGTNRFEYGELDLKPETSLQADAGVEIASQHVSFNANIFLNAIKNFIYYRKLQSVGGGDSIIVDGSETFFAFRFNQDNAKLYGAEFNLDIHPHPMDWLHINNTFTYVRGMLDFEQDGSKNLPFIPAPRLIDEIRADFGKKGKSLKNGYVKLELDNTFAQNNAFTGFDTETPTPGYSLLNAGIGADILSNGKPWFSIYLSANNLTDKAYQNHLSRLKYSPENMVTGRMGVFNMGRNFSIKLNIPFSTQTK